MIMKPSIAYLLFSLFLGVALAQEAARPKRVRRGLINVPQTDELARLTNEFGDGDHRDLQDEEMAALMGEDMSLEAEIVMAEDMSFSYGYLDMSFSYGARSGKRAAKKSKGRRERRRY